MSPTALVVHGHFYQPPRENPWTHSVEREPSAEPFHDWNERIYQECYRPNAYARIFDDHGRISRIVNNYRHLSFNFGPTLLSWLERHHSLTYSMILAADRDSALKRGGHGNAIAQGYNHAILPLCNARDRLTQVKWGVADFKWRFGRNPEALWLPETACDDLTLSTLVDEGMRFVVLSPYQAERVRHLGGGGDTPWQDARGGKVEPGVAYKWFHPDGSGRSIAIFFYDGPRSRSIAFENTLASSKVLLESFANAQGGSGRLVSVATDGESYGHHTKWGDRCLAHAFEIEAEKHGFWVTNYAEFLDRHPPAWEAEIARGPDGLGTSWSCAHGVGRWFRDCGCHTAGQEGWDQAWRGPLRKALDLVRDKAETLFESAGADLFVDPWAARNAFIDVLLDPLRALPAFFERHQRSRLGEAARIRARTLLEMQRNALLMYTSCGWFFSDISGIESVQVLKYAERVNDLFEELDSRSPRDGMLEILAEAKSNKKDLGNGADICRRMVDPVRVTPGRAAAHLVMANLVDDTQAAGEIARFTFRRESAEQKREGRVALCTAEFTLQDTTTLRTHRQIACGVHLGGVDFFAAVRASPGPAGLEAAAKQIWSRFPSASVPSLLRLARQEFGPEEYGMEHVLAEGPARIKEIVFGELIQKFSEEYARLYEENRRALEMLQAAGFELPKELRSAAEFTLGRRFEEEIQRQQQSYDPRAYERALAIASEVAEHGYRIDRTLPSQIFGDMINARVLVAVTRPTPDDVEAARALIELTQKLGVSVNVHSAQEAVYETASRASPAVRAALEPLAVLLGMAI